MSSKIKELLDDAFIEFASRDFIPNDPILIPHRFNAKEDIEIAGFFTATIAWGQRATIIKNASRLIELMDDAPYDFILNHNPKDRIKFKGFVHRTFNGLDAMFFLEKLQTAYKSGMNLEKLFEFGDSVKGKISGFHHWFFDETPEIRTRKHVSNPETGSTSKRLNMYLRWMVRPDNEGIDFGIWKSIKPSELMIPLDVHTGRVARRLGLLQRKQDDWRAVEELTSNLRSIDPTDPIKYDLALFGLGVSGAINET